MELVSPYLVDEFNRKNLDRIIRKYERHFGAEYIEVLYNDLRDDAQEISGCTLAAAVAADSETTNRLENIRKEQKVAEKKRRKLKLSR